MIRFTIMSRLGLAEPLVRLVRAIEKSNRAAASLAYATSARLASASMAARASVSPDEPLPRA